MGDGAETLRVYKEKSKRKDGAPTSETALSRDGEIVVGKFVDRERPDYAGRETDRQITSNLRFYT